MARIGVLLVLIMAVLCDVIVGQDFNMTFEEFLARIRANNGGGGTFTRPRPTLRPRRTTTPRPRVTESSGRTIPLNDMDAEVERMFGNDPRLIPLFARMIFHDCVGGCDGCINMNQPKNAGLQKPIAEAEKFRSKFPSLSQADINAYLGTRALEKGAQNAGGFVRIDLKIGRKDCDKNNMPMRNPPGGDNLDPVKFLMDEFGLTTREAVALLGVHSLGKCSKENSGFEGQWDRTPFDLDNGFFQNMAADGWVKEKIDNNIVKSHQWTKKRPDESFMMLHSDMILLKSFSLNQPFDDPTCAYNGCPASSTSSAVGLFANSERSFHAELQSAFQKMVEKGGSNLRVVF